MSKKKIVALVTSALVTVGVAGTTLALFTSKDAVTNTFSTIQDEKNTGDAGIEIYEKFDSTTATGTLPGVTVDKVVQVKNTAKYSQLIRVKLTPKWAEGSDCNEDVEEMLVQELKLDNWTYGNDGYYYYKGRISSGGFTDILLKNVTLSKDAPNSLKNCKYEVVVEADSVQSNVKFEDSNPWSILNEYVSVDSYDVNDSGDNEGTQYKGTIPTEKDIY